MASTNVIVLVQEPTNTEVAIDTPPGPTGTLGLGVAYFVSVPTGQTPDAVVKAWAAANFPAGTTASVLTGAVVTTHTVSATST